MVAHQIWGSYALGLVLDNSLRFTDFVLGCEKSVNTQTGSSILNEAKQAPVAWDLFKDLMALAKPRLSLFVILTAVGGISFAPGTHPTLKSLLAILCTALIVGGANALNCYFERSKDGQMRRTMTRPFPAGRLPLGWPMAFWLTVVVISLPTLAWAANLLTAGIGLAALVIYAFVYTPLKYKTPSALYIGAIPGAAPPLMGWTTVTNSLDLGGLSLFAVLFFWQLPHFLAISLYLKEDYGRAGMQLYSIVYGERRTRIGIVVSSVLLVPATLSLVPLGLANMLYGACALALGAALVVYALKGLRPGAGNKWARSMFLATLIYIPLLFGAMVAGAV